jgi:hypothetical protein
VEPSGSQRIPAAKSRSASSVTSHSSAASNSTAKANAAASVAIQGKVRRLVAYQTYFGIEARAFHAGAARMLARMSAKAPDRTRITVHSLGEDFRLDAAASWTLLRAFVGGKLLHANGAAGYVATPRFREYALASVVVPLSRPRAKVLLDAVRDIAVRINADWDRNPFLVKLVAVSGSYMSRRDQLAELTLWVVLRRRPQLKARRWKPLLEKDVALRQIVAAIKAPSSFIVVRIVKDKQNVQRPFSVVFQTNEDVAEPSLQTWERLRGWSASISRRLVSR